MGSLLVRVSPMSNTGKMPVLRELVFFNGLPGPTRGYPAVPLDHMGPESGPMAHVEYCVSRV
jgi:hypothetical protein